MAALVGETALTVGGTLSTVVKVLLKGLNQRPVHPVLQPRGDDDRVKGEALQGGVGDEGHAGAVDIELQGSGDLFRPLEKLDRRAVDGIGSRAGSEKRMCTLLATGTLTEPGAGSTSRTAIGWASRTTVPIS